MEGREGKEGHFRKGKEGSKAQGNFGQGLTQSVGHTRVVHTTQHTHTDVARGDGGGVNGVVMDQAQVTRAVHIRRTQKYSTCVVPCSYIYYTLPSKVCVFGSGSSGSGASTNLLQLPTSTHLSTSILTPLSSSWSGPRSSVCKQDLVRLPALLS